MQKGPEPWCRTPLPANPGGPLGPIYPHVAVGQRACLGVSRVPCLDCTLPCTLPCTPPLHSSFLHSFYRFFQIVFLRNSFSLFSDRFSAGCFLSCCFSEGILLILVAFGPGGVFRANPGERSFSASIFGPRFFPDFLDF